MAKNTFINSRLWDRSESQRNKSGREWCYTCQTWVKPIEKMGGYICPTCRRQTDPYPEKKDIEHSK